MPTQPALISSFTLAPIPLSPQPPDTGSSRNRDVHDRGEEVGGRHHGLGRGADLDIFITYARRPDLRDQDGRPPAEWQDFSHRLREAGHQPYLSGALMCPGWRPVRSLG
ncbi:hypothetical protein GCM10010478_17520 [Streptomyces erythrogriseus]|uniref:Resolvase/invertase-type recombinase catalytic domain-containing protein n=1 Tax=Streptomyces erythrogriseus TaxID=284027 RepID=A0ABN3WKU6_9ACTN